MNKKEAKKEVRRLFDEGVTSPQVKERLQELGFTKEQSNAIALEVIDEEVALEEAQDNYKSTLIYGTIATIVGLMAIILTWEKDTSQLGKQMKVIRWVFVVGLGLLVSGYRKWQLAKKARL